MKETQVSASAPPNTLPWPATANADASTTMQLLSFMLQAELRQPHTGMPDLPQITAHPPTMMAAIGAMAGYAAQYAAAAALHAGKKRQHNDLIKVGCADGSVLYYGDEINRHLILDPRGQYALAGFLAGAVINQGFGKADLADQGEILRHISEVACKPEYDIVRAPADHAPLWNVSQILKTLWPKAHAILQHRLTPPTVQRPMDVQHWPVAAAIVAQQYIGLAHDLIPPPVAMAIILEAALKASKRRLVGPYASLLFAQDAAFFSQGTPHAKTH